MSPARSDMFLLSTVFCYNEVKVGLFFASRKQFQDFSVKRFCFIHTNFLLRRTIFYYIGTFIETKVGLKKSRETRVSVRGQRITGKDPSKDAQSFPNINYQLIRSTRHVSDACDASSIYGPQLCQICGHMD
jgi:hypothetical protein